MSDTPQPTASQSPSQQPPRQREEHLSVIIRPWPKVVFLYPTFVCATLFWAIQYFSGSGEPAAAGEPAETAIGSSNLGNIFMIVFFTNMLVFSFDFSRIKSITIVIGAIAIALAIGWADSQWGIALGIKDVLAKIDIQVNTQFYGFVSLFLAVILALVFLNTRFNYYEVNHQEILHHHGYLGDIYRQPTHGLRFNKEIYDLMEYALLKSGRLIFYPATSKEAIVIDNVLNVNKVEDRVKELLRVIAVTFSD